MTNTASVPKKGLVSSRTGSVEPAPHFIVRVPFLRYTKKADTQKGICFFGTAKGTRTPDLLIRSQSLYPTELLPHASVLDVLEYSSTY